MGLLSKIRRYYLFYGIDEYSKMKKVNGLIDSVVQPGFRDFDFFAFESRGLDIAEIINAASSPPFGSPLKVILLRDVDRISPKGQQLLIKFLEDVPKSCTLVMTINKKAEKIDKRKKFMKALFADKEACVSFEELEPSNAAEYAIKRAEEFKLELSPAAAEQLIATVGCDKGTLDQELTKLSLYKGDDAKVESKDITLVSAAGAVGNVFELPARIASGDAVGAVTMLNSILKAKGQQTGTLLYRLKEYFVLLMLVNQRNYSSGYLIKRLRILPGTAQSLIKNARHIKPDMIADCLHLIYEGEINLKSASMKNNIVLLNLISGLN